MYKPFFHLSLFLPFALSLNFSSNLMASPLKSSEQNAVINKDSVLRHVVLFKFKSDTTPEKLKAIETAFIALPHKIAEIVDFEWGLNNSLEGLDKGFTHCYFVTFMSEKGREIYLPHPDHKAFVDLASPHIEDVLVVDYWTP